MPRGNQVVTLASYRCTHSCGMKMREVSWAGQWEHLMEQPSHNLWACPCPPSMNLLLTSGLISSGDSISCTGLNVVIFIDFSSIKITSGRCCIGIPGIPVIMVWVICDIRVHRAGDGQLCPRCQVAVTPGTR